MNRLAFAVIGVFTLASLVVAGCAEPSGPAPGEEVSTCVICHTDKDLLKQTASVEEVAVSEETSGEG
ncbi:hypothetical protein ACFLW0_04235 [Chloroflexota bacterium]